MTIKPQYLEIGGQQMVVLSAAEFAILSRKADRNDPPLPEPDEDGCYPYETLAIIMAQDVVKTRRDLGLTQAELAKQAHVRLETLQRIEQGKDVSVRTTAKVNRALDQAERKKRKPRSA